MKENYDHTDRFIRETECKILTGLSRTTRWRLAKNGSFPKNYKISSGIRAWKLTDLRNWIDQASNEYKN